MAIAGIPQNLDSIQGNYTIALKWDATVGATSYAIQRSLDGVTYSAYATSSVNNYLDSTITVGTMYWYQVASVNGSGTSSYSEAAQACPAPPGELSLYELKQRAKQRADRTNSDFVTDTELTFFIDQSCYELYDLLIDTYEDYYCAPEVYFMSNGSDYLYPLPNGLLTFINSATGSNVVAPSFYKLLGIDLGLNNANNAYVTMNKYNLIDRNKFVYPNSSSTIYGVFNLQYRIMGTNIRFIPTPSANQPIRLLYVPRLPTLIQDTDISTIGYSGWLQYVIVRAAKYILDKEESPTDNLDTEIAFLKLRIEESAVNRDAGSPDTVSDTRSFGGPFGSGFGQNGSIGGWAAFPGLASYYQGHSSLTNAIHFPNSILGQVALGISLTYFLYFSLSKFSGRISFSRVRNFIANSLSAFFNHVMNIVFLGSKKQMIRINAKRNVTFMTYVKSIGTSVMKLIRNPVSKVIDLINRQATITSRSLAMRPEPASISLVNSFPKSSFPRSAVHLNNVNPMEGIVK